MCLMGATQATVFALCVEKDWSQWRLGWSIKLLTAAYSGIVASGLMVVVIAWCVKKRGPLYASVFNPVQLVVVAIVGSLMLDENLYLGSAIGAVLIIIGLYSVLWGKSKELKNVTGLVIDPEIEQIEVVVTPDQDHDHIKCSNNNCEINIVSKDHDSSLKSVQEGQDIENNRGK
uniref:WAT1-related protein n=2 Tax=Lotus japonicus TaxID=34305 RepID=I3SV23_LOTJA|nr:unknown [Lotus japonicus]